MRTRITITGDAGCINNVLAIVREALEQYCYRVKVVNDMRDPKELNRTTFLRHVERPGAVKIVMRHKPWQPYEAKRAD